MKRITGQLTVAATIIALACEKIEPTGSSVPQPQPPSSSVAAPVVRITNKLDTLVLPWDSEATLDAGLSYDSNQLALTYTWKQVSGPTILQSRLTTQPAATFIFTREGTYQFEVVVTNSAGKASRDTATRIAVQDIVCSASRTTIQPQLLAITVSPEIGTSPSMKMIGSRIFIAGGFVPEFPNDYLQGDNFHSDTVLIFDLETRTWKTERLSSQRTPFSITPAPGNMVLFVSGGKYYGVSDVIDIYNTGTGQMTQVKMPAARETGAIAVVDNKLVIAGGSAYGFPYPASARVDVYDIASNTWTERQLSQARHVSSAVSDGTRLYLAGGYAGSMNGSQSNLIEIFDPQTGSSTSTKVHGPGGWMQGAAFLSGMLWTTGYESSTSTYSPYIEFQDWQGKVVSMDCLPTDFLKSTPIVEKVNDQTVCFYAGKNIALYEPGTRSWREGQLPVMMDAVFSFNGKLYGIHRETQAGWRSRLKISEILY